jgi:hypothetical protein
MAELNLPNIREGGNIRFRIGLEDGGVAVDWSGLEDIRVFLYADAQKQVSGEMCEVAVDEEDNTVLKCKYSGDDVQYRGINSVLVRAKYLGEIKVYDKPAINIVARTSDATGVVEIDDPVVPVQISVEDVSTSLLNNAIDAAINAAAEAEKAAHLVPLQVLEDCVEATGKALEAASKAPYIDETTGNWFVWDAEAGEYVDSGKTARGATGNGIASWSVVESQEDAGNNVVTVTFTDGTSESFNVKNGHTGNGIASIVQTVESPDDAGTNVITITMTNGTVVTFNVKNGSKGTPGVAQAAYKSVSSLPTASAQTMDMIYLTPSGTSGVYNMSYTEFDGSAYSWQDLGTTAIQLSDYATKAELSQLEHKSVGIETQHISDLDISDEYGNVLVRFKDGGIKTKEFDSSKVNLETEGQNNSDLDIADEFGNVLVRFKDGGIKTKNFDSKKFADAPASGYENFLVQVNVGVENNDSTTGNLQDSSDPQNDRCIINFPPNYDANGEPVRLVIANFGSAGRIQSSTTKAYHTMPLVDTILAEGYAVMQVNGTPGQTDGIATYGGMGTPAFLQSVQAAYKYVTDKYNIKKDGVLLSGWSQGTLKAWQIAANKVIPVKAAALFAPVTDLWKLQYAYAPKATREWMCEQFGFVEKEANKYVLDIFGDIYEPGDIVTKPTTYSAEKTLPTDEEFAYILNNFETWLGYDPICWGTSKDIIGEQFRYRSWVATPNPDEELCFVDTCNIVPCPMKMFVGTADIYATPKIVNWYRTMANNGGMLCHIRTYEDGTHNFPSDYTSISVSTKFGGTITTNVPSWEGMLFLERYD